MLCNVILKNDIVAKITLCFQPSQSAMLKYIKDTLYGLLYVHDQGFIQLDIKPSNILVSYWT